MRIDNTKPNLNSPSQLANRRHDEAKASPGAPASHKRRAQSTELGQLVKRAGETESVRQDVVELAMQKVNSGELLTHEAAARTIDALLREQS